MRIKGIIPIIAVLASIWACLPSTPAYYFEEYNIVLGPSGDFTLETISFLLVNDGNGTLNEGNYTIGTGVDEVKVTDSEGLLHFTVDSSDDFTTILYDYRRPLHPGNSTWITISFKAQGMIGRSIFVDAEGLEHEDRVISTGFSAPAYIQRMEVLVRMPPGAWLARSLGERETTAGSPVQPLDADIKSNGTKLVVSWTRERIERNDRFDLMVAYNFPGREVRTDLGIAVVALLAGVALGGAAGFLFLRGRSRETQTKHTLALLDEGERKILKAIMGAGGEIRQDELLDITGYSKARVSQLVTRLEKLGLVRKEKFERTNKLFVTGEVREA